MLERVQTHTRKADLIIIPFAPVIQFFAHFDITVINIAEHQIIVVSHLITNHILPSLAMTVHDAINDVLGLAFGIIHTRKTGVIPFKIRMLFASTGECEFSIAANGNRI